MLTEMDTYTHAGDTCTVSNTFSGTGYGTVNDAANAIANNHGTWGAGSDSVGNASSNQISATSNRCHEAVS
jgi:hypothetical protein